MIKFKQGSITTVDGVTENIVVKAAAPNTLRDALIGGAITIAGVIYLTVTAFRHGAQQMEAAEFRTMDNLNLFEIKPKN